MAALNLFNNITEHLPEKVHDLGSDSLKVYLSNAAPSRTADSVKADVAEIATGSGYTGPVALTVTSSTYAGNVYSLVVSDLTPMVTASGPVATFQYAVIYNDTPVSPADPLIGWFDYGSAISLTSGETFGINFGASLLTITALP